jgi:hypothetical protein
MAASLNLVSAARLRVMHSRNRAGWRIAPSEETQPRVAMRARRSTIVCNHAVAWFCTGGTSDGLKTWRLAALQSALG